MAKQQAVVPPMVQIGETAGAVWHALNDQGPLTIARLLKAVPEQRDLVMQALGWLAREGKLVFDDKGRTRTVALRDGG